MAKTKRRIKSREAREIAIIRWTKVRQDKINKLGKKFTKIIEKNEPIKAGTEIATLIVNKKVK